MYFLNKCQSSNFTNRLWLFWWIYNCLFLQTSSVASIPPPLSRGLASCAQGHFCSARTVCLFGCCENTYATRQKVWKARSSPYTLELLSQGLRWSPGPALGSCLCHAVMMCLALQHTSPDLPLLTWLPSLISDLSHHCKLSSDQWAMAEPAPFISGFAVSPTSLVDLPTPDALWGQGAVP